MGNQILDANAISDLQSRMAALEAALGKYNQANAIAGVIPSSSLSSTSTTSTAQEFSLNGWKIHSGTNDVSLSGAKGRVTVTYPQYKDAPVVICTAQIIENNAAIDCSTYLGTISATSANLWVKRIDGKNTGKAIINWIVIGKV